MPSLSEQDLHSKQLLAARISDGRDRGDMVFGRELSKNVGSRNQRRRFLSVVCSNVRRNDCSDVRGEFCINIPLSTRG